MIEQWAPAAIEAARDRVARNGYGSVRVAAVGLLRISPWFGQVRRQPDDLGFGVTMLLAGCD